MSVRERPSEQDPLPGLLQSWKLGQTLPAGFREAVWERIAGRQGLGGASPWAILLHWMEDRFRRPVWVVSYSVVLLTAGLLFGFWRAQEANHQLDESMARRYVRIVAPYQSFPGRLP